MKRMLVLICVAVAVLTSFPTFGEVKEQNWGFGHYGRIVTGYFRFGAMYGGSYNGEVLGFTIDLKRDTMEVSYDDGGVCRFAIAREYGKIRSNDSRDLNDIKLRLRNIWMFSRSLREMGVSYAVWDSLSEKGEITYKGGEKRVWEVK